MKQLELFEFERLSEAEKQQIFHSIRNHYWTLRNLRKWEPNAKYFRRAYRKIEVEKKRLRLAGVSKNEILNFLHCCRGTCKNGAKCKFCGANYR